MAPDSVTITKKCEQCGETLSVTLSPEHPLFTEQQAVDLAMWLTVIGQYVRPTPGSAPHTGGQQVQVSGKDFCSTECLLSYCQEKQAEYTAAEDRQLVKMAEKKVKLA